ncbi:phage tail tube protein, partial [Vibrio diabolicus]
FTLEVGDITSIGELSDSASTSEVTVYGEGYTNTFTTVKNVGQVDLEFLANTEDAGQTALETLYENQETASFDIRLIQGDRQTDYMFNGQVSKFGITSSADDVVRYSVSLVVHGKVTKENKASA